VIRVISLLQLAALGILVWLCLRAGGHSAIAFSFVGVPLLVTGLAAYAFLRSREAELASRTRPPPDRAPN
jgi:hypothetical protein